MVNTSWERGNMYQKQWGPGAPLYKRPSLTKERRDRSRTAACRDTGDSCWTWVSLPYQASRLAMRDQYPSLIGRGPDQATTASSLRSRSASCHRAQASETGLRQFAERA
jgi:hypothetical protein